MTWHMIIGIFKQSNVCVNLRQKMDIIFPCLVLHCRHYRSTTFRKKEEKIPVKTKLTPEQMKLLTFYGRRKLVPGYIDSYAAKAFAGGTDSSVMISEDRDTWQ